jgi:hypothetical protein
MGLKITFTPNHLTAPNPKKFQEKYKSTQILMLQKVAMISQKTTHSGITFFIFWTHFFK